MLTTPTHIRMNVHVVKVFVCGTGLREFTRRCLSFVCGTLEVKFLVVLDRGGEEIVHDNNTNLNTAALGEKKGEKREKKRIALLSHYYISIKI